jgi:hypothetical protein
MGLDKRFLIEQLAAHLRRTDEVARRAGADARALIGKRAGDYVEVTINRETREWKLVEVS